MKNSNGGGSISKLKGKRRKPWVVRFTTGYSSDGKQIRKSIGTFATKREAQEALYNYNKNPLLYSKKTFKNILDLWWSAYTKKVTQKTTISTHIYRMRAFEPLSIIVNISI